MLIDAHLDVYLASRTKVCTVNVIRASVPKLTLDESFEQKNEITKAVEEELEKLVGDPLYRPTLRDQLDLPLLPSPLLPPRSLLCRQKPLQVQEARFESPFASPRGFDHSAEGATLQIIFDQIQTPH
ncbi:hypothetical protein CRG98_001633 [Punica granatum]|uniref:Uncharacterized protein n=1 Tax=Punica granatum TaxID=22663 RepID=A0A2I0LBE6_PUNGR|nr:hypothetical protein CRG98_001633 [Punica granatum]